MNPWLGHPATPRRLYRDALEEPTLNVLFGHNTAVITTGYEDGSTERDAGRPPPSFRRLGRELPGRPLSRGRLSRA